jgi:hypothetical protein
LYTVTLNIYEGSLCKLVEAWMRVMFDVFCYYDSWMLANIMIKSSYHSKMQ